MYAHASAISDGHPYPLLNAIKLDVRDTGRLDLEPVKDQLKKAEELRRSQVEASPPEDVPWCFFDLAEICLYNGDKAEFQKLVEKGIEKCSQVWEVTTFRDSLKPLVEKKIPLSGLVEGMKRIEEAVRKLEQTEKSG